MYLPSLPGIASHFGVTTGPAQLTLSAFLIGMATSQLLFGPLSDRYGRRAPLLAGLAIYTAAGIACMFAPSIELLIIGRFLQAIGAGAPLVIARAVVRDIYEHEEMARMLAQLASVMAVIPMIAPVFGGALEAVTGWRANFAVMAGYGIVLAAVAVRGLPETLATEHQQPVAPLAIAANYGRLLRSRVYLAYLAITCAGFGGLFAFISGSSFVLQTDYGSGPLGFGVAFGICVVGYIAGTQGSRVLVARVGIERTLGTGAVILLLSGLVLLLLVLLGPRHPAAVIVPMTVFFAGVGLTLPQAIAGALAPFPDLAGTASALLGFVQMAFGATAGAYVGHAVATGPMPLAVTIAAMGGLTVLAFFSTRRTRRATA